MATAPIKGLPAAPAESAAQKRLESALSKRRSNAKAGRPIDTRVSVKPKAPAKAKPKAPPYDPLAPLSGTDFNNQVAANVNLQYQPQEDALAQAQKDQAQNTALTNSAYDAYKSALNDALTNINTNDANAVTAQQAQVNNAFTQDNASAQTDAGRQAAAGAQGLGNAGLGTLRTAGTADNAYMSNRTADSVLQKAEALQQAAQKKTDLDTQAASLAKQKGEDTVAERGKLTDAERQYSAVQKEFGLKVKTEKDDTASATSTAATQKYVADVQAAATQEKAAATIKVAKEQLAKGKIDQHQYTTVTNVYKGLPKKGVSPTAKATPKTVGKGSGPNGTWSPSERDKLSKSVNILHKNNASATDQATWIQRMVDEGIPHRIATAAWRSYRSQYLTPNVTPSPR